jgi:hypothetical protein
VKRRFRSARFVTPATIATFTHIRDGQPVSSSSAASSGLLRGVSRGREEVVGVLAYLVDRRQRQERAQGDAVGNGVDDRPGATVGQPLDRGQHLSG